MKNHNAGLKQASLCFILLLITSLILASCGGKKEVKPVSPEAKLAQEAFALAETLRKAYGDGNRSALQRNCTAEGFKLLMGSVKAFERAELTFTPTWVEIRDSSVYLTISWKGSWLAKGRTVEDRGQAIFVLEGAPLKLARIERANPFSQPE